MPAKRTSEGSAERTFFWGGGGGQIGVCNCVRQARRGLANSLLTEPASFICALHGTRALYRVSRLHARMQEREPYCQAFSRQVVSHGAGTAQTAVCVNMVWKNNQMGGRNPIACIRLDSDLVFFFSGLALFKMGSAQHTYPKRNYSVVERAHRVSSYMINVLTLLDQQSDVYTAWVHRLIRAIATTTAELSSAVGASARGCLLR